MSAGPHTMADLSSTPMAACKYASIEYTERRAEAVIERSVGSASDSADNALDETINGL